MNYREAIAYLNSFINFERVIDSAYNTNLDDIDRFRRLLSDLEDPHLKYPVIHVAGTKGKGSTAAILTSILRAAGYRVGLYTSPHLVTVRERIRVDGRMASKAEFAGLIRRIQRATNTTDGNNRQSYRTVFEHLTAAAFQHFANKRVDIAVVEAGLGGRLDATIVVNPAISVITPIGLDHTAILGDTVEQIAAEKAFVIKPGSVAVSAPQSAEVVAVLRRHALTVGASLTFSEGRNVFKLLDRSLTKSDFSIRKPNGDEDHLTLHLPGSHQLDNVSTAITCLDRLSGKGFTVTPAALRQGIQTVRWPGRMQFIRGNPSIVLDGSHNEMAVKALSRALSEYQPDRKWRVVFSGLKGKPIEAMLVLLSSLAVEFYLAPIQFPKSIAIDQLSKAAQDRSLKCKVFKDIPAAINAACQDCQPGESVLATGSLYLVGEIMRHRRNLPSPPVDGGIDWRI